MVVLNETIMGVAIPNLVDDLGITIDAAQWLTTAFMLTMAVIIPITGLLIQRFTTRQIFTAARSLFSLGTLVAALAPGFEMLLAGRIVQATGTAMMMPLLMTTIMTLVPAQSRGRFMGRISIVMAAAPALGPTISGLILSIASWRYMFWLVLPIAVTMLIVGNRRIENVGETQRKPIDVLSVVLSAFGFGGVVFGLSLVGAPGDAATQMWIALGAGALGNLLCTKSEEPAAARGWGPSSRTSALGACSSRWAHAPAAELGGGHGPTLAGFPGRGTRLGRQWGLG